MRQTTDRPSPKKNVAQFWDRVFSPFQIKTSHFNTVTCRTVRQVTFCATSRSCTDKGRDKSPVSGHTHTHTDTRDLSHIYLSHSMSHLCRYKSHLSNTILMSPMDATRRIQNLSLSSRTTCRTLNNRRKRRIEFCTQVTCRVNCPSQLFVSVMKIALIDATRRITAFVTQLP